MKIEIIPTIIFGVKGTSYCSRAFLIVQLVLWVTVTVFASKSLIYLCTNDVIF